MRCGHYQVTQVQYYFKLNNWVVYPQYCKFMEKMIDVQRTIVIEYMVSLIARHILNTSVQFEENLNLIHAQVAANELQIELIVPKVIGDELHENLIKVIDSFPVHFKPVLAAYGMELYIFTLIMDANQTLLDKCNTDVSNYQQSLS